jgi:EmrB/QacA subfamily drug resistance transporter
MARKWWTLLAVSVATFMLLLDITVFNVALPSIREDLRASFTDLQWVLDAYALTLAALVLTAGSLADRFGRRKLFAIGLAIFSVASLLCALAPEPTFLNLARALQGVGGAVMFAVSLALIAQEFRGGRERGMAMGMYGATIGVAVAIGPLVGGALTDGLGWESIFYLNLPIGLAALAVTHLKLRESRDPNATRIDWAGVATFSAALFLLVLALLRGNEQGWSSGMIVSLLAGSAILLTVFVAIEARVREPMLPLGLFRIPSFTGVQLAAFAVSGSLFALFLYLTLYLQSYLGHSPFETGLRYPPITLLAFLFSAAVGGLIGRVPARVLMSAGLALSGLGMLLMAGIETNSTWTTLLGGFLVAGAGVGLLNPVIADVAVSVVPEGAKRDGGRDQRHLPPGRHRRRDRSVGRGLHRPRRRQGRGAGRRNAGSERAAPARARRGRLLRQPRSGARRTSRPGPAGRGERGGRGIPCRPQQRAHARRAPQLRRRRPRALARARARDRAPAAPARPRARAGGAGPAGAGQGASAASKARSAGRSNGRRCCRSSTAS